MRIQIDIPEEKLLRVVTVEGTSYFNEIFGLIGFDRTVNIGLTHEPTNLVDKYAIKVSVVGIPIGYLVREDAYEFNSMLYILKNLERLDRIRIKTTFVDFNIEKMPNDTRRFRYFKLKVTKK